MTFAGFWRRVAASLIDGVLLNVLLFGLIGIFVVVKVDLTGIIAQGILSFVPALVCLVYFSTMESSVKQATVGKLIVGLRVTDLQGARITFWRALGRNVSKIVSGIIFGIGFLMAGFTARKQALHDSLAGCLVMRSEKSTAGRIWGIALIALLLMAASGLGIGYYVYSMVIAQFNTTLGELGGSGTVRKTETTPQETANATDAFKLASALLAFPTPAEYETFLVDHPVVINRKPSVSVKGSAIVFQGVSKNKVNGVAQDEIDLIASVPVLPYWENILQPQSLLQVSEVRDAAAKNVFDSEYLNDEFFQRLKQRRDFVDREGAINTAKGVHLVKGAIANTWKTISGKILFRFPVDPQYGEFLPSEVGKTLSMGDATVTLTEATADDLSLDFKGFSKGYVAAVVLFDAEGKNVELERTNYFGSPGDFTGEVDASKPYSKIVVIAAPRTEERSYPFVLNNQ